ncbi:MAG: prolyl oligopeptidase family serine peptidase [Acidobacteria bacterium]|nr:prolyl oligopeptidase family serine peptidase [Acidobacteriota bacterium]
MKTRFTVLIALLVLAASAFAQKRAASLPARMQGLLHLPQNHAPLAPKVLSQRIEGDIQLEDLRFQAERGVWVQATVVKLVNANQPLPAIICLPGTSGTRHHLTDAQLKLSPFPRTGWARALAREGFLTISLDYRGSAERQQNIFTDAVREQLAGRSYMGLLVYDVMRAVDYLQTRPDVARQHIGVTGFSLGGAMSWYAAAADARLRVVVPVCSGAGTYAALLQSQKHTSYHSQYFYPAGFWQTFPGDQPELFAALAPRAVLVVGRDQDQGMPVEGLHRLEQEVRATYQRRGVPERFAVHLTPGDHNYSEEMFAQVKQWFVRFLKP